MPEPAGFGPALCLWTLEVSPGRMREIVRFRALLAGSAQKTSTGSTTLAGTSQSRDTASATPDALLRRGTAQFPSTASARRNFSLQNRETGLGTVLHNSWALCVTTPREAESQYARWRVNSIKI